MFEHCIQIFLSILKELLQCRYLPCYVRKFEVRGVHINLSCRVRTRILFAAGASRTSLGRASIPVPSCPSIVASKCPISVCHSQFCDSMLAALGASVPPTRDVVAGPLSQPARRFADFFTFWPTPLQRPLSFREMVIAEVLAALVM